MRIYLEKLHCEIFKCWKILWKYLGMSYVFLLHLTCELFMFYPLCRDIYDYQPDATILIFVTLVSWHSIFVTVIKICLSHGLSCGLGLDFLFLIINVVMAHSMYHLNFFGELFWEALCFIVLSFYTIIKKNGSFSCTYLVELVELPPKTKPIGCKWVFKIKLQPNGTINKYKACLVAKGYKQKHNVDYFDTCSPVTRITSNRVLFAFDSIYKLILHQMDVNFFFSLSKSWFRSGDLYEAIYGTCGPQPRK